MIKINLLCNWKQLLLSLWMLKKNIFVKIYSNFVVKLINFKSILNFINYLPYMDKFLIKKMQIIKIIKFKIKNMLKLINLLKS